MRRVVGVRNGTGETATYSVVDQDVRVYMLLGIDAAGTYITPLLIVLTPPGGSDVGSTAFFCYCAGFVS